MSMKLSAKQVSPNDHFLLFDIDLTFDFFNKDKIVKD